MLCSLALLALGLGSIVHAVTIDMEGLPDTGLDTSSWKTGTAPPIANLVNINDMQIAAKNTLGPADYAYYRAAALDEISMTTQERHRVFTQPVADNSSAYQANMLGWSKLRLNGFSFTDVSNVNLKSDSRS